MIFDLGLPEIGENLESAGVTRILVSPGTVVSPNQIVIEVETEKAAVEIPTPRGGRVTEVLVREGEDISIGTILMRIETGEDEVISAAPHAAPETRRFAREVGVDLNSVKGTGPDGLITPEDVKAHAKRRMKGAAASEAPSDLSRWGEVKRRRLSRIRRITASRMAESWGSIPHVTAFDKADITELDEMRRSLSMRYEDEGVKITLTAIIIRFVAEGLVLHPDFNSCIDMASGELILRSYINIGVAVDTPRGLIVPVIRDAGKKTVLDIAREVAGAAARAREGKTAPEELEGGTFTITNLGGIGGGHFTPIIKPPEVAILGIGRAGYEPVWNGNIFRPRLLLPLALSYDHRAIDGADGARFLRWITEGLAKPFLVALSG